MNIAIQGIKGSFHHIATMQYFENQNIDVVECKSFSELPDLVKNDSVDYAVMAVEESSIGAFQTNYSLIDKNDLNIEGEVYVKMEHDLIALGGQTINDIKEIITHPLVFTQCSKFLKQYKHIKLIESYDTAEIAKKIKEKNLKGVAAIGSRIVSEIYDLPIIAHKIENDAENLLRFFVLQKNRQHTPDDYKNNKASLKLLLEDKVGALAEVLNILVKYEISLVKIESLPIKNKQFNNRAFFIDLNFNDYLKYCQSLLEIEKMTGFLKILGEYKAH